MCIYTYIRVAWFYANFVLQITELYISFYVLKWYNMFWINDRVGELTTSAIKSLVTYQIITLYTFCAIRVRDAAKC